MNIHNPTLAECIAYLRDGGDAYERERRANMRPMRESMRRAVGLAVVCGESEDLKLARQMGCGDEAKARRGENNG